MKKQKVYLETALSGSCFDKGWDAGADTVGLFTGIAEGISGVFK